MQQDWRLRGVCRACCGHQPLDALDCRLLTLTEALENMDEGAVESLIRSVLGEGTRLDEEVAGIEEGNVAVDDLVVWKARVTGEVGSALRDLVRHASSGSGRTNGLPSGSRGA